MILSKQDIRFVWRNLHLVKLCSISDHFFNYFSGYYFFKTVSQALHLADQCSSLDGLALAPHRCATMAMWLQTIPTRATFLIPFHILGQKKVT